MNEKEYEGKRLEPEKKTLWSEYGYLLVTAVVVLVLFRVIFQLAWVPSGSMETTIPTKSLLLSLRLPYMVADPALERGDVVTFQSDELGKLLVKRVIGLPGDQVSFESGYVYINGQRIDEPYLREQGKSVSRNNEVFQVPEGCYFMMGDNRTSSDDSRFWDQPYVKEADVRSEVLLIISVHKDNSWRGLRTIT